MKALFATDAWRRAVRVIVVRALFTLARTHRFATLGANVVLVCRSEKSCATAAEEVRAVAAEGATITHVLADFTNLIEVGEVASQLKKKEISIDIAVLNAAVRAKAASSLQSGEMTAAHTRTFPFT